MATFILFPNLPAELRCKIWDAACFVNPRVFKLEREKCSLTSLPTPRSWRAAHFRWMDCVDTPFWVAKRCKHPTPSVLLVCKEAYQESKKYYRNSELRYQDNSKVTCFNPYCDILYLGWSTCLGTVIALVESDVKFTRIAFEVVEALHYCDRCTDRVLDYPLANFLAPYLTVHVDRLTRILRVLHGFVPRGTSDASLFPGCGALKDVFLLTNKAGPFEPYILRSNPCVGIEKYTDANPYYPRLGVGRPQRTSMDGYLGQLMTSTLASMGALDGNTWATGKRPTLHPARQSNPLPEGCAFEMMALHIPGVAQHRMVWWTTRQFEQTMVYTIYPPEYSGPGDYVLKFLGYPQEIAAGRTTLAEEIDKVEAIFKTKIAVVEPRQAVFPIPELAQL